MRHGWNLQQLDDILAIFEAAGVQALVLKGPVLANRYYQPPFLRKPSGMIWIWPSKRKMFPEL